MGRHRNAARALAHAAAGVAVCTCLAGGAGAQEPVLLDPSARAGGMGDASVAVAWAGAANAWANPALAATVAGLSLQTSAQVFTPGEPVRSSLQVTRFTLAVAGLAWTSAGRPLGDARVAFAPYSIYRVPWVYTPAADGASAGDAVAFSAASFADALAGALGHPGRCADRFDLAWGRQWQRVQLGMPGISSSVAYGEGWLARLTPLDTRRDARAPEGGVRVEISYGNAMLDSPDLGYFLFPRGILGQPALHVRRDGGALRLAWYGPQRGGQPGAAWADAFRGALAPLADLTLTAEHERSQWTLPAGPAYAPVVSGYGAELTLVRCVSLRCGDRDDPAHRFHARTYGWGVCLPLGRDGEARYDFASLPQADGPRIDRHTLTLRLDPIGRWLRPEPAPGS